jgi:hypothetical protein
MTGNVLTRFLDDPPFTGPRRRAAVSERSDD